MLATRNSAWLVDAQPASDRSICYDAILKLSRSNEEGGRRATTIYYDKVARRSIHPQRIQCARKLFKRIKWRGHVLIVFEGPSRRVV